MRRTPLAVGALALALSGCFTGCGPTIEGVAWTDPDFAAVLSEAPLDGWVVRPTDPPAGAPTANRTLLDWGASLVEVERQVDGNGSLRLHHRGQLTLAYPDADAGPARHAVETFLAEVTDGNGTERGAWTQELLDGGRPGADLHARQHGEDVWLFETDLPRHRLRLDAALRIVPLGEPATNPRADGWGVHLAFPEVWAQRGAETFYARLDGNEYYGDWPDDAAEGEARTRFQAAYRSLGVGEPPTEVEVVVVVC